MSFSDPQNFVIHSKIQSKRPISIGSLRSTKRTSIPLSNRFELRPTTSQLPQKEILSQHSKQSNRIVKTPQQNLSGIKQSKVYPMIIFCQSNSQELFNQESFRQMLKDLDFDSCFKSLRSEDHRNKYIHQLTCELFEEIQFTIQNLLICQHRITRSFKVYFAEVDCDLVPLSKCCNSPIIIEISQINQGQIICINPHCDKKILSNFLLKYSEVCIIWPDDQLIPRIQENFDQSFRWQKQFGTRHNYSNEKIPRRNRKTSCQKSKEILNFSVNSRMNTKFA